MMLGASATCNYISKEDRKMCDAWGTETGQFTKTGAVDTLNQPFVHREWGLKDQCEKQEKYRYKGKYFLIKPISWYIYESEETMNNGRAISEGFNYERGICLPDSCSIEEVLLLTSKVSLKLRS